MVDRQFEVDAQELSSATDGGLAGESGVHWLTWGKHETS